MKKFQLRRLFVVFSAAITLLGFAPLAAAHEHESAGHGQHVGHGAHHGHEGHHAEPTSDELAHQPGAQVGQRTLCPIMGGEFEITDQTPSAEYEGQKVYFCCPGCVGEFEEDPATALEGLAAKIDAANAKR